MKKLILLTLTVFSLFFVKPIFAAENFDDLIGTVDVPKGVDLISTEAGEGNIGILILVSRLIQLVVVVASIWVVVNVILAAYVYLSGGGKADSHQKVNNMLTMSVTGLIIIVSTYTLAGLIGLIFFGNATYIIQPTITEITNQLP